MKTEDPPVERPAEILTTHLTESTRRQLCKEAHMTLETTGVVNHTRRIPATRKTAVLGPRNNRTETKRYIWQRMSTVVPESNNINLTSKGTDRQRTTSVNLNNGTADNYYHPYLVFQHRSCNGMHTIPNNRHKLKTKTVS